MSQEHSESSFPDLEALVRERAPELLPQLPVLVRLLQELAGGALSRDEGRARLDGRPELKALVAALHGFTARQGGSVISFGQGPQFGDIQIHGGVAGRDIYHFSFPVLPAHQGRPREEVRARRRAAYEDLFRLTSALARYTPASSVDADALTRLSADLRDWYYGLRAGDIVGGLSLEERCRVHFFELKDAIKEALAGRPEPTAPALASADATRVLAAGKALRDALREDIGAL